MLQILPALILLVLQGPAAVDRSAVEGRSAWVLEAMAPGSVGRPDAVLAQLLAAGEVELAQALAAFLSPTLPQPAPKRIQPSGENQNLPVEARPARLCEGFAKSQRSRDGPVA